MLPCPDIATQASRRRHHWPSPSLSRRLAKNGGVGTTSTVFALLVAGAIYGGGAVGVELFTDSDLDWPHYNMWAVLERRLEMMGVILLIYAALDSIRGPSERAVRVEVGLEDEPASGV